MAEIDISNQDVEAVQFAWHELFKDDYVPSDEYTTRMIRFAGETSTVIDAIQICADNERIACQSYDARMAYTYGIIKNLRDSKRKKKWSD